MTTVSDVQQGTLTTSATTEIYAATGDSETLDLTIINYSGSARTVNVYLNGEADVNRIVPEDLSLEADGGTLVISPIRLGAGDKIHAKASAGTAVSWTAEIVRYTSP